MPGAYDQRITVSALADSDGIFGFREPNTTAGPDDTPATFSNFGADVDISAPGGDVHSTYPTNFAGSPGYAVMSGCSMATPHVAGAAALYLATHHGASPATVRGHLLGHREPLLGVGEGVVNVNDDTAKPHIAKLSLIENSANQHVRGRRLFYRAVPGQTGTFAARLRVTDFESGLRRVTFPDVFGTADAPGVVTNYDQTVTRSLIDARRTYSWNGSQALTRTREVAVMNGAGSVAMTNFTVVPDVAAPTVGITVPADGASIEPGAVLQANAADAGGALPG